MASTLNRPLDLNDSGLAVASLDLHTHREFHLTLCPLPGESPTASVRRLTRVLKDADASIVRHEVFATISKRPEILAALHREFGNVDWPMIWCEGTGANNHFWGMHVFAVAGVDIQSLSMNGRPVGRFFSAGPRRHCLLADLRPTNLSASKFDQCKEVLERLEHALDTAGLSMLDLARTWFFLDDISSWYNSFNDVRNAFYGAKGILRMPASTGIGCRHAHCEALMAGAWAIRSDDVAVCVRDVPSPLQCPSIEYGSAFSRAVLLDEPDCKRLLISGTASIQPNGQSAHIGDLSKQIELVMEVIGTILKSRACEFSNVTRATAYLKNAKDLPLFAKWLRSHEMESLPFVVIQAEICRPELMFEVEMDALVPGACMEYNPKTDLNGLHEPGK